MTSTIQDTWTYNDGGRAEAGFKGDAGDCVARAVAIATGRPYREVYDELAQLVKDSGGAKSARNGIPKKLVRDYIISQGFAWTPTMKVGQGTTVHLKADELPGGTIIASVSKHVVAVIDGQINDTHDPSRDGKRAVYGYYTKEA